MGPGSERRRSYSVGYPAEQRRHDLLARPGAVLTERYRRTTETVMNAHGHIGQVGRCCTLLLQSGRLADANVAPAFPSP